MIFSNDWNAFLSQRPDIQGGALISANGELISWAKFGSSDHRKISAARCAALAEIARQLVQDTERGEVEQVFLKGEHGYIILMPMRDSAILILLKRKSGRI